MPGDWSRNEGNSKGASSFQYLSFPEISAYQLEKLEAIHERAVNCQINQIDFQCCDISINYF